MSYIDDSFEHNFGVVERFLKLKSADNFMSSPGQNWFEKMKIIDNFNGWEN